MKIGYLSRVLPCLSETFVVREIAALRRLGLSVVPFSLLPPDKDLIPPEAPGIAREAKVIKRPFHPMFWLAHIFFALRHPLRYFGCLLRYVFASSEPLHNKMRALGQFAAAPFAAWLVRRAGIGHLHAHFANSPAGIAMMAARLSGIEFSFTAHAYDIFQDNMLLGKKLAAARWLVTISRFNLGFLEGHFPEGRGADIRVVHCGIDPEVFLSQKDEKAEPPEILAVGRFVKKKGFHTLVKACAVLAARGVEFRCIIVGDGPELERIRGDISKLRLEEYLFLTGALPQAEVMEYYKRASVFALPCCECGGEMDGIPVVLMEAMAMEIPVVSTTVSGIPELVCDGETGLLVKPEDADGLAAAIERLLENPTSAGELAAKGREFVISEFNILDAGNKMFDFFTAQNDYPVDSGKSS